MSPAHWLFVGVWVVLGCACWFAAWMLHRVRSPRLILPFWLWIFAGTVFVLTGVLVGVEGTDMLSTWWLALASLGLAVAGTAFRGREAWAALAWVRDPGDTDG